jgi:CRP/FNR family transcriptional regulator, cyclic AMP receptor protein
MISKEKSMDQRQRDEYVAVFNSVLAFKFLDEEERRYLFDRSEIFHVKDGESFIKEGELDPYLYVVLSGSANVTVRRDGKDIYICMLGAGEVMGEAGLFMNVARTANAVACGPSVVLRLKREPFLAFVSKFPRGGSRVLLVVIYGLLKKLRDANRELAFERKSDVVQADIDELVSRIILEDESPMLMTGV